MTARYASVPSCLGGLHPSRVPSLGREPKERSPSVTRGGASIADAGGYAIPSLGNLSQNPRVQDIAPKFLNLGVGILFLRFSKRRVMDKNKEYVLGSHGAHVTN